MLGKLNGNLTCLQGQLAGGHDDHALDGVERRVDLLENGDGVGPSLAGTVLGARQYVPAIGAATIRPRVFKSRKLLKYCIARLRR